MPDANVSVQLACEKKRRLASKKAEMVSLLISMAQMQAEVLREDRFEKCFVDDRFLIFHVSSFDSALT
jgi:hypothetical protein